MPNRIIRDWTDSLRFDGISADAERLFVRLLMKADDYGRFHADPRLVRAGCFPLTENIRANDLVRWLAELSHRQLILCYDAGGRSYLAINNFRQRLKQSVPKFPPPDGRDRNWLPDSGEFPDIPGSSGKFREVPARVGDGDVCEDECESAPARDAREVAPPGFRPPTLAETLARATEIGVPRDVAETWWNETEGAGWIDGKNRQIKQWQPALKAYANKWQANDAQRANGRKVNGSSSSVLAKPRIVESRITEAQRRQNEEADRQQEVVNRCHDVVAILNEDDVRAFKEIWKLKSAEKALEAYDAHRLSEEAWGA